MRSPRLELVPWTAVSGFLLAAIASVALAQRQTGVQVVRVPPHPATVAPQARQVLQAMGQFFRNVKSLRAEVTVQTDVRTPNGIQPVAMRYVLAMHRPDKLALTQITSLASPTIVCDGHSLYIFQPATMQYIQEKAPAPLDSVNKGDIAEAGAGLGAIMHWILQSDPYQAILEGTFNANYLGQDMTDGIRTRHVQLIQAGWHVDLWV